MSLAGKKLDIFDDNAALYKEATQQGLTPPQYVLDYRLPEAAPDLPDEFFAYVSHSPSGGTVRKYACDSRATTWINGLYFLKLGGVFAPPVQTEIATKLARFHDIHQVPQPDLLTKVAAGTATVPVPFELPSEPVTENLFAVTKTASKPLYPIATWDHIEKAAAYFERNWRVMPPVQRREFCVKVAARVRELGRETINRRQEMTTSLSKVASLDVKRGVDPARHLSPRMELYASKTPCQTKIAATIGERIKMMEARNQDALAETYRSLYDNRGSFTVDKFAEALCRMDNASGLDDFYDKRLADPFASILKIAEDTSSEVVYNENGVSLTRGQVQRFGHMKEALLRRFEPDLVEDLVAEPEAVFLSLPRREKQALAALLK